MAHSLRSTICFVIPCFLFLATGKGQTKPSESSNEFETEETGEEIVARELFFQMRRAGGPGKSMPAKGYETAMQQSVRLKKDRDLPSSLTAANNWVSVTPNGLFYSMT